MSRTPPAAAQPSPAGGALRPADPAQVVAAVQRANRLGPMLGIRLADPAVPQPAVPHPAGSDSAVADCEPVATVRWRQAGELPVDRLLAAITAGPAGGRPRLAASLLVLGYSARLLGPGLAVLLHEGLLLDLAPERVGGDFGPGTGFRLTLDGARGHTGPLPQLLDRWGAEVLDRHLAPVVDAVRTRHHLAEALFWGNVASGAIGALSALHRQGVLDAGSWHEVGQRLLALPRLAGSGRLEPHRVPPGLRRRSCCLYYQLPGGGTCADCPLPAAGAVPVR